MKKNLLLMACLLVVFAGNVQPLPQQAAVSKSDAELRQFYLQKAKHQKTAGLVFLIGGLGLMAAGIGQADTDWTINLFPNSSTPLRESKQKGLGLFIAGGISTLTSLPFILASGRNRRKAHMISGYQSTSYTPGLQPKQTTLGIAFPIGR
jgi:hypothetical protein